MDEKMNARIKEAVGIIGRFLSENHESFDSPEVAEQLLNMGFSEKEIAGAFRFIEKSTLGPFWSKSSRPSQRAKNIKKASQKNKTTGKSPLARGVPPVRMLSDVEATKIDHQAHNYLLQLHSMGAINMELMEEIIDRALGSSDEQIGIAEIRRMTALLLFTRMHMGHHDEGSLSVSNTLIH